MGSSPAALNASRYSSWLLLAVARWEPADHACEQVVCGAREHMVSPSTLNLVSSSLWFQAYRVMGCWAMVDCARRVAQSATGMGHASVIDGLPPRESARCC